MSYGIYLLKYHGNGFVHDRDCDVTDASFTTIAKDPIAVVDDAVAHIIAQYRREQDARMPTPLETMYTYEKLGMIDLPGEAGHASQLHSIHIHAALDYVPDILRSLRVEVKHSFNKEHGSVIDEAIEIVNDKDVTIALLRYVNPGASPVKVSQAISKVKHAKVKLLSTSALNDIDFYVEQLSLAIGEYSSLAIKPPSSTTGE